MFHFVPRKVAQRTRPSLSAPDAPVPGPSSTPPGRPLTPKEVQHLGTDAKKAKGKNKDTKGPSDEDLATLLTLSLSDHALWTNVDLRRAVSEADEGWIPLSFLVQHSTYLLHLQSRLSDSTLVRAIRGHAEDVLEIRMRVTAPSKGAWYGKGPSSLKDDEGGYEIRLKHTADALARVRNSARNEWEARTVYVENVPVAHRTVAGIHRFLSSLLPVPTPCSSPPSPSTGTPPPGQIRIQTVTLPAHHLDRPGAPPKCKGFALVTCASAADATHLATAWPWLPRRTSVPVPVPGEEEGEERGEAKEGDEEDGKRKRKEKRKATAEEEAVKFGFRALPKARWDALKDEYLEHRQRLIDEIARQDASASAASSPPLERRRQHQREPLATADASEERAPRSTRTRNPESEREQDQASSLSSSLDPDAPYPPGCLVFVRGVHPETNKTTLKALLSAHAPPADYVDYAKGMVSCHARLSTPPHALALVAAFADRPLAQTHGLDGAGSSCLPCLPCPPSSSSSASSSADNSGPKRITAELVDGEREALYWHKVPEKVRREAVRKAIALALAGVSTDAEVNVAEERGEEGEGAKEQGKRPRKRRRKA